MWDGERGGGALSGLYLSFLWESFVLFLVFSMVFSLPVILGDLYSPIISWDFLFSSSPVSAHDDVSGSKVVSRGCVVSFWTSNGADKVDFCHLKSP